ncbi:MAG: hypothetical protein AB7G08_28275 [Hyphomicrobiaceae bacterium]
MTDTSRAARLLASSPHAMPIEEARAHIAERRKLLLGSPATSRPEPSFAPVPMPFIDAPDLYAADFVRRGARTSPAKPKSQPKQRPGRKPVGELPPGADRFTVIDGDGVDK